MGNGPCQLALRYRPSLSGLKPPFGHGSNNSFFGTVFSLIFKKKRSSDIPLSKTAQQFLAQRGSKTLVFTNGCFDILHRGHIAYLAKAKELGDLLFVGLNSDQSVKKLKGHHRPIVPQNDRKFVLENIKGVDFVEIFSQETPYQLIKEVAPDILVKGGDWEVKNIVGHDLVLNNGGRVLSLDFVPDFSTTSIIEKIKALD